MRTVNLPHLLVVLPMANSTPAVAVAQANSSKQNVQELPKRLTELPQLMKKLETRRGALENIKVNVASDPRQLRRIGGP